MTGLRKVAKKVLDEMLDPQNIDVVLRKFTRPGVESGGTTYPNTQQQLKNLGFHFDLADHHPERPDTRPNAAPGATRTMNVFQWQAAKQAEAPAIKNWARKNGTHKPIQTFEVPKDATKEEFEEILREVADKL